jgi:histidine ammonia-lyase
MELVLDGNTLEPSAADAFSRLALDPKAKFKLTIAAEALERVKRASDFVGQVVKGDKAVYGINTGFGKFAEVAIAHDKLVELQENLIRSHCAGYGEPLSRDLVLLMWTLRLNTVSRGHSGVRPRTIEHILKILHAGILAVVPSRGSVGASGDLAPSAHMTLACLGEGLCTVASGDGFATVPAAEALVKAGIEPLKLGPKEGLSLINGTQLTTALAIRGWAEGRKLLSAGNLAAALSLEGLRGSHSIFREEILEARNQPGALACGREIASWADADSEISRSHENCGRVQDSYSLRCAPQVHGMLWEELSHAETVLRREANASTDNPLLFPEKSLSVSGGNFHAAYTAKVCDNLAAALATFACICERRVSLAMTPESSGLPAFLTPDGGLNSGFMMAQVTAAALASECKAMSFPASVDSIPTSGDREDHVSMGPTAGLKLQRVVENVRGVIAVEIMSGCQALDMLAPLKPSARLQTVHAKVRSQVARLDRDRVLSEDIRKISDLIDRGLGETR